MSESDSFIHEVSEEVRRERLYAFLRRRGWLIAAAIALVIGGAAANEWRKARAEAAAEAAGDTLRAALFEADPAVRAARLAELAQTWPRAAVLAGLARAGSLAEAGEREQAGQVLAETAADPGVAELYRALAALQRVMLLGPELEPGERRATLETLSVPGAPFRPLALEQRALMHLEAGDREAALADLEAVLVEPGAPEALTARARQLIVAAGGAVPVGQPAGLPPADG